MLPFLTEEIKNRIFSYIDFKEKSCWNWTGTLTRAGYGVLRINGSNYYAHRLSYKVFNNKEPNDELEIIHSCDNPKCCNPDHLTEATHKLNMQDAIFKGRSAFGENHGNATLSNEEVEEIKKMYQQGYLQEDIARKFEIRQQTVSRIVNYRRRNSKSERVARNLLKNV